MDHQTLWQRLCLYHVPQCGPALVKRLIAALGGVQGVLGADAGQLQQLGCDVDTAQAIVGATGPDSLARQAAERALDWVSQHDDHHLLWLEDEDFPPLLREIPCPPVLLFGKGERSLLQQAMVAVVGSRHASHYGREQAHAIATGLARRGLVICSGLAMGIDAAAHNAAVSARLPTVAVLGSGIERVYPAQNRALAQQIQACGLLLSEFPLHAAPLASHFPRRNRIISGLSLGVIVIEATLRSGSLITARLAMEQNREVFALPGAVSRNQSRGCHQLLREGAALVEVAEDVIEVLAPQLRTDGDTLAPATSLPPALPVPLQQVLACVDEDPLPLDVLLQRSGLQFAELSRHLLQLEIRGRIAQTAGGYFRC